MALGHFITLLLATAWSVHAQFQEGTECTYRYEGVHWMAMPQIKEQYSAAGLRCSLAIQKYPNQILEVRPTNCQYGELHNHVSQQTWRNLPLNFNPLPGEWKKVMEIPCQAKLGRGNIITEVKFDSRETVHSINIKKSILSQLQLDLKGETSMEKLEGYHVRQQPRDSAYYHVMEPSIGGNCRTAYMLSPKLKPIARSQILYELFRARGEMAIPSHVMDSDVRILYKTKPYDQAPGRSTWNYQMPPNRNNYPCDRKRCYQPPTNRSTTVRYVLSGDKTNPSILEIKSESAMLADAFDYRTTNIWAYSNQTFVNVGCRKRSEAPAALHTPVVYRNLTFSLPTADRQPVRMPSADSPIVQLSTYAPGEPPCTKDKAELTREVADVLQRIEQIIEKSADEKYGAVSYLLDLEQKITWLPRSSLEQIERTLHSTTQRQIYYNSLVSAGTAAAVKCITQAIQSGRIEHWLANALMARLPMHLKQPVESTIEDILRLADSEVVKSNQQLHANIVLAAGNLLNQICVNNATVDKSYPTSVYGQFCTPQVQQMVSHFIDTCEHYALEYRSPWQIAYLQAMGNTGHPKAVRVIQKLLGQLQTTLQTTKAIYALSEIAHKQPVLVRQVMMSVFNNPSRNAEVRQAAFICLMSTNPPAHIFQTIAASTWWEESTQVASIVYSTFTSLAQSPNAEFSVLHSMSCKAAAVLPLVRAPPRGLLYSTKLFMSSITPRSQASFAGVWSAHFSRLSLLPSTIFANDISDDGGYMYEKFKQSITLENMQKHVIAMFNSSEPAARPHALPPLIQKVLRNLQEWNTRLDSPKTNITSYTRGMDSMDFFCVAQFDNISKLVPASDTFYSFNKTIVVYLEDRTVQTPSEIGFSYAYIRKSPVLISVKGIARLVNKQYTGFKSIEFKNVRTSIYGKVRSMVRSVSPVTNNVLGAAVDKDIVVSLKPSFALSYDPRTASVELTTNISHASGELEVFKYRSMPYTVAGPAQEPDPLVPSAARKPIQSSPLPIVTIPFGEQDQIMGKITAVGQIPLSYGQLYQSYIESQSTGWLKEYFQSVQQKELKVTLDMQRSRVRKAAVVVAVVNATQPPPRRSPQAIAPAQSWQRVEREALAAQQVLKSHPHQPPIDFYGKAIVFSASTYPASGDSPAASADAYALHAYDPSQQKLHYECKYNSAQHKVCGKFEYQPPQTSSELNKLLSTRTQAYFRGSLEYGQTSCSEQEIQLDATLLADPTAVEYARSSPEVALCQQHQQSQHPASRTCEVAKDLATMLSKVDVVVRAPKISDTTLNYTRRIDNFVKYFAYPFMDNNPLQTNQSNQVGVTVHFDPYMNALNLTVNKPRERTAFRSVYLPHNAKKRPMLVSLRHSPWQRLDQALHGPEKHDCRLDQSVLKTFDNVTIERRKKMDQHILLAAMRWSENSYAAVLGKQAGKPPSVWVLTDGHEIVIKQSSPGSYQVLIDGSAPQPVPQDRPIDIPARSGESIGYVYKEDEDKAIMVLRKYYIVVKLEPKTIIIKPSKILHINRVSGACGDFNGEVEADLVDSNFCVSQDPQHFLDTFCVKMTGDSACPPPAPSHPQHKSPVCIKPDPYWP